MQWTRGCVSSRVVQTCSDDLGYFEAPSLHRRDGHFPEEGTGIGMYRHAPLAASPMIVSDISPSSKMFDMQVVDLIEDATGMNQFTRFFRICMSAFARGDVHLCGQLLRFDEGAE
jgi:hypothetical protein